jgi:thimet oligopeptidase
VPPDGVRRRAHRPDRIQEIAMRRLFLPFLLLAALGTTLPPRVSAAPIRDDVPFWTGSPSLAEFGAAQQARIARAESLVARIKAVQGPRTIENTLRPYDEGLRHLSNAARQAGLVANTHPDEAMRAGAETLQQTISSYATKLSSDPELYRAIAAIDAGKADAVTR